MYEFILFVLFLVFIVSICIGRWNEAFGEQAIGLLISTYLASCIISTLGVQYSPELFEGGKRSVLFLVTLLGNFISVSAGATIGFAARNVSKLLAAQADAVKLTVEKRERPSEDNGSMP